MCGGRSHSGGPEDCFFLRVLTAEGAHAERNRASGDTMRPSFISINMPLLLCEIENVARAVLHMEAGGARSQNSSLKFVDRKRPCESNSCISLEISSD